MAILNPVPVSHGAARHWLFAVLAGGAVLAARSQPAPAPMSETASAKPPMATTRFQTVTLSVDWHGSQQAYHIGDFVGNAVKRTAVVSHKARQAMVSEDGSAIGSEWDEAKLTPFNCCIFNARRAVPPGSLTATGFGFAHPVESNDTVEGRARNRRVEFACAASH